MRSVAAAGNADSLRAIANAAHSVKSGAAQVSAKRLHIACVELEAAAQAGASERAYAALEVWYAACDELLSTLSDVSSYEKLFEAAVLTTQQQQPSMRGPLLLLAVTLLSRSGAAQDHLDPFPTRRQARSSVEFSAAEPCCSERRALRGCSAW